ncbi:hypothetical protein RND81_06G207000 [Saponaria officinalis]|uniref:S-protein homolog n=1 Tax=Saponaria officinalis TaxID=3572 RepID=A0AAW1KDZ6_SAPOF
MLIQLLVIILSVEQFLRGQQFVRGFTPFKVQYIVNIENNLNNDNLDVHCHEYKQRYIDYGSHHLLKNANYSITLKASVLFDVRKITCTLTCFLNCNTTVRFRAFFSDPKFIDNECGGRHCFFKLEDDGIYLYNIKKTKYAKYMMWWNNSSIKEFDYNDL